MVLYTLILQTVIDCSMKKSTPLIHGSRVSTQGLTSSCAVVEEGVPVCRDPEPEDAIDILRYVKINTVL